MTAGGAFQFCWCWAAIQCRCSPSTSTPGGRMRISTRRQPRRSSTTPRFC